MNYRPLLEKLEWLEWHYEEFRNPFEFDNYNKIRCQYKVSAFEYCSFCHHNLGIFIECWSVLKWMQLYNKNSEHYNRLKNILIKSAQEFHVVYVRKKINRIKHLKRWIYEYYEYHNIENIKESMNELKCMEVSEDQLIRIANMFSSQLDELIKFIANDNYPPDKFISKHFS